MKTKFPRDKTFDLEACMSTAERHDTHHGHGYLFFCVDEPEACGRANGDDGGRPGCAWCGR